MSEIYDQRLSIEALLDELECDICAGMNVQLLPDDLVSCMRAYSDLVARGGFVAERP